MSVHSTKMLKTCILLATAFLYITDNISFVSSATLKSGTITDDTLKKLMGLLGNTLGNMQNIPDQNVSANSTFGYFNVALKHGSVYLSGFNVPFAHVDMDKLEFRSGFKYSSISLLGNYKLYIDNDYVHAESADEFSVNVTNVSTDIFLKLNLTDKQTLQIEDIKVDYNASIKVNIENLGGYKEVSDALNDFLNTILPDEIDSTKTALQDLVKAKIIDIGDSFIFNGMTVDQLIDYVNSLVESGFNTNNVLVNRIISYLNRNT